MSFQEFRAGLAGGALLAGLLLSSASPAEPAAPHSPQTVPSAAAIDAPLLTATGTVLSVDVKSSRLEVITGVGLALRVLKMNCGEQTEIRSRGKGIGLDSLKRGDLVRVSCRPSREGNLAIAIELLPPPGAGGGVR